ncbi:MAG: pitrilysin family protein [Capnocytophaga sp.]|nr:pitrilysin family protein [Capnocytophaga sp.]
MKKIFITASLLLTSLFMTAQVDRNKMPESGKIPTINIGEPTMYKLANGLTLLVVENHKLPRISVRLTMDTPPSDERNKPGVADLTSALMGKGSKNISKDDFNEEVEFLGAEVSLSAKGGNASSLTRYFPRVLELFADAALNPNFTQEELDKERARGIEGIKASENSAQAIAGRVNDALVYTTNHPYGKFQTEASLNSVNLADVQNFYRENFSPANAYMVVLGDIKPEEAKTMVEKYFLKWIPAKSLQTSIYSPKDVQYTQINLIDVPNAVQSEINIFNLENLKMGDKDYFPVLIMNYILGGGFGSYINMNLREQNGFTYGARSSVDANKWTEATFNVSTKVRNEVTARAVEEIFNEIRKIQNQNVPADKLAEAKALYLGSFIMATENPATIARFALNKEVYKLPKNFYANYIKNIEAVTAADVKRVANKYIKINNLRVVIVGKASEIADSLEAMKFNGKALPVFYFDKFANKTTKPEAPKMDANASVESVIKKYIDLIGGKEKLQKVNSVTIHSSANVQGQVLNFHNVIAKGKMLSSVETMGMVIQKIVFNGQTGYIEQQGQKMDLPEEMKKTLAESSVFPELEFNNQNAKLLGIENINGEDAYAIQKESTTYYYSTKTGLKVGEISKQKTPNGEMVISKYSSDYKEVEGVKYPFQYVQNMAGMDITLTASSYEINKATEESFK